MLKLTRTAIGLLTAQYRSVLRKCWAINVGIFGAMKQAAAGAGSGAVSGAIATGIFAAAMLMPSEADALKWCINNSASDTPLKLMADDGTCPSGWTDFGKQSGSSSTALGFGAQANGAHSLAEGYYAKAYGTGSLAEGYGAFTGYRATASSYTTNPSSSPTAAIAIGQYAGALTNYSIAIGSDRKSVV